MIIAGSKDELAVGREDTPWDETLMSKDEKQATVVTGPQPRRFVPTRRNDSLGVRRKSRVLNFVRMALERNQQAAVCGIPYPRRMVRTGAKDALPVRGKPRSDDNTLMLENSQ